MLVGAGARPQPARRRHRRRRGRPAAADDGRPPDHRGVVGTAVLVAFSIVATFVYGTDTVLFVVLSDELLGTGAEGYGYLLAGLGVGGIAAAGLVTRLEQRPRLGR